MKYQSIMFLGDLHAPAVDLAALEWAAQVAEDYEVEKVIQVGDITDQRAWSRFQKDPDFENPNREWEILLERMADIELYFPKMSILIGNHDGRVIKKALEVGIPRQLVKGLEDVFNAPGWDWHLSNDPYVVNGNIAVIHGDEMVGPVGLKASRLGMNLVQGHSHQSSLAYVPMFNKTIWGMEVGCLVDQDSSAFRYAAKSPRKQWKGVGLVLDGVPVLIPCPF